MHKGCIILTKASSKEEALKNTKEFMSGYEGSVWDWYQIGGRWTNELPDIAEEFHKRAAEIINSNGERFVSQRIIDNNQDKLQKIWEDLEGEGLNPLCNHYNLPDEGNYYDVIPLSNCIKKVTSWVQSVEDAKKVEEEAKKWLTDKNDQGNPRMDYDMYGYALQEAANLYQQRFSFDCNVFNIDSGNFSIPENPKGYYAVMIDMHN